MQYLNTGLEGLPLNWSYAYYCSRAPGVKRPYICPHDPVSPPVSSCDLTLFSDPGNHRPGLVLWQASGHKPKPFPWPFNQDLFSADSERKRGGGDIIWWQGLKDRWSPQAFSPCSSVCSCVWEIEGACVPLPRGRYKRHILCNCLYTLWGP